MKKNIMRLMRIHKYQEIFKITTLNIETKEEK